MTRTISIHELHTHTAELLAALAPGNELVIAEGGRPIARISPVGPADAPARRFGTARGQGVVPTDFDAPVREIEDMFHDTADGGQASGARS